MQLIGLSQPASATIMVQLENVTPDTNFGNYYRWQFSATATPTDGFISGVSGGDVYFTIYDLPGTLVTVEAPNFWSALSTGTGITPAGLIPTDDSNIDNVTFRYSSLSSRPGSDAIVSGSIFDIILSTGNPVYGEFSWQDYSAYPYSTGQLQSGLGTVAGQGSTSVPEPATLILLGSGLAGLISLRKKFTA
jgi:hypothetical protein